MKTDFDIQKDLDDLNRWEEIEAEKSDGGLAEAMDALEGISPDQIAALEASGFQLVYMPATRITQWMHEDGGSIRYLNPHWQIDHWCGCCGELCADLSSALARHSRDQHEMDCMYAPEAEA